MDNVEQKLPGQHWLSISPPYVRFIARLSVIGKAVLE